MRFFVLLGLATFFSNVAVQEAHAMAGELRSPSLAMPADTSPAFRTNLLAVISSKDCQFLDGSFINASTTLHYGGSTEALNNLIARLGEIDGVRVTVNFVRNPGGPAWTLKHMGWGDPEGIFLEVNVAAPTIKLEQLSITSCGCSNALGPAPGPGAKPIHRNP